MSKTSKTTSGRPLQFRQEIRLQKNGHVGVTKDGLKRHKGFGYEVGHDDGERIFEYIEPHSLVITNTKFHRRSSYLVSLYSGNTRTQIEFVLVRRRDQNLATYAKIGPHETVATQDRQLICTMKIMSPRQKRDERCGQSRIK
ncbi:hypothetical protein Y032_0504g2653 [Ancylostoma ceylanicum]|uniref:Uncharacterized protein n=1 Tax=Ancylostoma ceylanicum TaxID=53326 RepID=A0A016WV25_9BILA|nr:hypothetical protein Y032_0504g2653 [Ancylostoma ceylanicum]